MKIILTVAVLISINALADSKASIFKAATQETAELATRDCAHQFNKAFIGSRIALGNSEKAAKLAEKGFSEKQIADDAFKAGRGTLKDPVQSLDKGILPDGSEYNLVVFSEMKDGQTKSFFKFSSETEDKEMMYEVLKELKSSNTNYDVRSGVITSEIKDTPSAAAMKFKSLKRKILTNSFNSQKIKAAVRRPQKVMAAK